MEQTTDTGTLALGAKPGGPKMVLQEEKQHPVLFSSSMVKAILENRKTQTRRIVKNVQIKVNEFGKLDYSGKHHAGFNTDLEGINSPISGVLEECPYGKVGTILWVRETWQYTDFLPADEAGYVYKASENGEAWATTEEWTWKPSIFMPKAACRIYLRITDLRIERVQDISEEDAVKEGINQTFIADDIRDCRWKNYINDGHGSVAEPSTSFSTLWKSINGEESWNSNTFVWVIGFERIEKP